MNNEGVGQGVADVESLDGRVAVIERVGPGATPRYRVVAVGAGRGRGDRLEGVRCIVDVAGRERTACDRCAFITVGHAARLIDCSGAGASDQRGIVGAVDGNDYIVRRAVGGMDGKGVGRCVADIEVLDGRIVVIERVAPVAGSADRPGAVAASACLVLERVAALSTSVSVSVPVTVGVPAVPLFTPPASTTAPVSWPETSAASLAPWIVMATSCSVPSCVWTEMVSVSVSPTLRV